MSKAHHDPLYYRWLEKNRPDCINPRCVRRREQFHHMELVGSKRARGPVPRRYSTYNVVWICSYCHREVHDTQGERLWLRRNFRDGLLSVYKEVLIALSDYRIYLTRELHDREVIVPVFKLDRNPDWPALLAGREVARQYHDELDWLYQLAQAHGVERTGQTV